MNVFSNAVNSFENRVWRQMQASPYARRGGDNWTVWTWSLIEFVASVHFQVRRAPAEGNIDPLWRSISNMFDLMA